MKGQLVMRFVGNRQEPEKSLRDPGPVVYFEEIREFQKEMDEWNREWQRTVYPFLVRGNQG